MLTQASPSAGVLYDLHTVAAPVDARVIVANRGSATQFKISLAPNGETDAVRHYVASDKSIGANETLSTKPLRLETGTVVRVQSASGNVSFTLNGLED